MRIIYSNKFEYETPNHLMSPRGVCGLVLASTDIAVFAIVTELVDNPGASITNNVESLYDQVKRCFNITSTIQWFEYYPSSNLEFTRWDNIKGWRIINETENSIIKSIFDVVSVCR